MQTEICMCLIIRCLQAYFSLHHCSLTLCLNCNIACGEEQTEKVMKCLHNCTSQEDKTLNLLLFWTAKEHMN